MPGERIRPRALTLPAVSVPRRLPLTRAERVTPAAASNPLAFLVASAAADATAAMARIALFHMAGARQRSKSLPAGSCSRRLSGQVEIACTSDAHLALIWEKALRHSWPVTLGPGIPAAFTGPGRALIGLCDWIETDFSAGHFRVCFSPVIWEWKTTLAFYNRTGRAPAGEGGSPVGDARPTVLHSRDYGKALPGRAVDPTRLTMIRVDAKAKADQTGRVRDWITALVSSVPAPGRRASCRSRRGQRRARIPSSTRLRAGTRWTIGRRLRCRTTVPISAAICVRSAAK